MLERFNDWLGDRLAYWLSTMAMFYGVAFLVVAPLFFQRPDSLVGWMQYSISVFFQGVALPVLGYVARKSGEKQERLLQETHDTVMKELSYIQEALQIAAVERDEVKMVVRGMAQLHLDIRHK
ncbi:MAG: hypothetical protein ACYC0Q_08555 [Eubacteriales bacterium]